MLRLNNKTTNGKALNDCSIKLVIQKDTWWLLLHGINKCKRFMHYNPYKIESTKSFLDLLVYACSGTLNGLYPCINLTKLEIIFLKGERTAIRDKGRTYKHPATQIGRAHV